MLKKVQSKIIHILSIGTYPGMGENKKLAIQVATFDGYWTLLTILFYFFFAVYYNLYPLQYFCAAGVLLEILGILFIYKKYYDFGRYLVNITGLILVFMSVDVVGVASGAELTYFVSATTPFVTFSIEERWKGFIISGLACIALIFQQILGSGLIFEELPFLFNQRIVSMAVSMIFLIAILAVSRWQMAVVQNEIHKQQSELFHNANLLSLGEMSGGIAHEINNPLQTLSLQNESLRRYIRSLDKTPEKVEKQLDVIDRTINKIATMVKGLKELSRDVTNDPIQTFTYDKVLDEVLTVTEERLKNLDIRLSINNSNKLPVKGHSVQIAQVLLNLLNNSIDALIKMKGKWINIEIVDEMNFSRLSFTDSGTGIRGELIYKIMQPFFTTKEPGRGTGLGLSISKSIIEKSGGRFYYDQTSPNTKFIIELPYG